MEAGPEHHLRNALQRERAVFDETYRAAPVVVRRQWRVGRRNLGAQLGRDVHRRRPRARDAIDAREREVRKHLRGAGELLLPPAGRSERFGDSRLGLGAGLRGGLRGVGGGREQQVREPHRSAVAIEGQLGREELAQDDTQRVSVCARGVALGEVVAHLLRYVSESSCWLRKGSGRHVPVAESIEVLCEAGVADLGGVVVGEQHVGALEILMHNLEGV
mmetsp:Transcript_8991/g.22860  ORF Transcript_8991/g.22860 Transcript_8991/m.22860 type:complete len:218 (-) Transcript_8991:2837-3490(-)